MTDATFGPGDGGDATVTLVPFAPSHLAAAVGLSQEMAWPYRLEDWTFAAELGRGFAVERSGTLVGTALWWAYGDTIASVGMIIVAKSEQGRGHGARMVDALLDATRPRTLLLNSTEEGLPLYRRRGFMAVGTIHQHQGILSDQGGYTASPDVRRGGPADFGAIAALDREATGMPRAVLLDRLIAVGDLAMLERGGRPAGFAIRRAFGRGQVIGPVVAETPGDARQLVKALLDGLAGSFVRLDLPADSGLGIWLDAQGIPCVGLATTMVLGPMPSTGGRLRIFAIAQQSLG